MAAVLIVLIVFIGVGAAIWTAPRVDDDLDDATQAQNRPDQ